MHAAMKAATEATVTVERLKEENAAMVARMDARFDALVAAVRTAGDSDGKVCIC
jgi:hypothetical protein